MTADLGPDRGGGAAKARPKLAELSYLLGTLATTAIAVAFALRLWEADPRVPFTYSFDAMFNGAIVKGIIEHGWHLQNPSLGAPFGLQLHDFPLGGDNLQFIMIKALGVFSADWRLVMNVYFILTFALVSVTAYPVLRQVGLSRPASLMLATVFSILPYHFVLGESSLFQSGYFAVPLGAFLVLDAMGWDVWGPPLFVGADPGRRAPRRVRWMVRGALCVAVASAGSYYAPFTLVLVAVAAGLAVLADRNYRAVLRAGAICALVAAVFVANNAPTLLYRRAHGSNDQVAQRPAGESDLYALHIVDLFLPAVNHRIQPLADLKAELYGWWPVSPVWPAPHNPLGAAAATGLAISLVVAVGLALRPGHLHTIGSARLAVARLGVLNLAVILMAVSTGFSTLLALAGFTQLRTWSRMSIFIGFFSLAALGLAAPAVGRRLRTRVARRHVSPTTFRVASITLATLFLVLAVLDQTQSSTVPPYTGTAATVTSDRDFVTEIERRLPAGDAVLQLPLASFPERPPIATMQDYHLLRGYLNSRHLRWSYGAMRGRPADWTWSLGGRAVETVLDDATAAGFHGLYVDRAGFLDQAAALEREVSALEGPPDVVSVDGSLVFWDLRARASRQVAEHGEDGVRDRRQRVLYPVVPTWGQGFFPPTGEPSEAVSGDFLYYPDLPGQSFVTGRLAQSPAVLELANPLRGPRPVRLEFGAKSAGLSSGTLMLTADHMPPTTVPITADVRPVDLELVLPPGATTLRIAGGPAGRQIAPGNSANFWIQNVRITDVAAGAPAG